MTRSSHGEEGLPVFQDTGVMDLLNDGIHQPVTVFLPSDGVMASLSQEQRDFLFHPDNRPQLGEYLKYHVLQAQKVRQLTLQRGLYSKSVTTRSEQVHFNRPSSPQTEAKGDMGLELWFGQ